MTCTTNALLTTDFASNQLSSIYNDRLEQRLANHWVVEEERNASSDQCERHSLMLKSDHTLAVTLNWMQQEITKFLAFIAGHERNKFIRNLYKVRLACDDLIAGAHYHDLTVDEMRGVDVLVDHLEGVRQKTLHEVIGGLLKKGTDTIEEARAATDQLLYFATCGLVGERTETLVYGTYILIQNGIFEKHETLLKTGNLTGEFDATQAANALNTKPNENNRGSSYPPLNQLLMPD